MAFRGTQKGPPKGYIPGLGRGAAGFTTRSDVGPAGSDVTPSATSSGSRAAEARAAKLAAQRQNQTGVVSEGGRFGVAPQGYIPGMGRGASSMGVGQANVGSTDGGPSSAIQENRAQSHISNYEDDDEEADRIYDEVDKRMKMKRKKNADGDINDNEDDEGGLGSSRKKISHQFRELKEQLATVSEAEWASIPDVGDYSLRYKQKRRQETFTPITDSLLESRSMLHSDANASLAGTAVVVDGAQTSVPGTGFKSVVKMQGLAGARETLLGMSLDQMSDSVTGQTVVDPKGYLTSMSVTKIATNAEVGDINKARLLLKSVRDTNPKHAPGWIAAARVEEAAGKTLQARKLIQEGCEVCPTNEDVWLEAARLHPVDMAKTILASAVRRIPTSVKIFMKAADLENHDEAKKAVLRKGLEMNPTSVPLWKAAIELEDAENAKILLSVAVEKVPQSVDMWLALARLETYENARKVLNQARRALPIERSIWIAAAKLEESQNHDDVVDKIVQKAVSSLAKHDALVTREQWIHEAELAEASGACLTSSAIIKYTIGNGVDVEDRARTWSDDANNSMSRGAVSTARAILAQALLAFPTKRSLWMQAVQLEQKYGNAESLDEVLATASEKLPNQEIFWLMRAKEQWQSGNIDKSREILTNAFAANPNSEPVWLAAAKLEWETGETARARVLLSRARERAPSDRVFMKSALLETETENFEDALLLIEEGILKYPKFPKLYMMGGQICSEDLEKTAANLDRARIYFQKGLQACPNSITLWKLSSRLEENAHVLFANCNNGGSSNLVGAGFTKSRSLLELARLKNPKSPELWLEAIRLERRAGNEKLAVTLMAKALQECPKSGILLAENISTCPRPEAKSKSADAIKKNPDDPYVICAVASLFASERKQEKARKWFERACVLNPDLGDSWAKFYAFESEFGDEAKRKAILDRCVTADPKHGEIWTSIMKKRINRKKTTADGLQLVASYLLEQK